VCASEEGLLGYESSVQVMSLEGLLPELKKGEKVIALISAERKGKLSAQNGIVFGPAWNLDQLNSYLVRLTQMIRRDTHPDYELLRQYLELTHPDTPVLPTNIRIPRELIEEIQREKDVHDPNRVTIFEKSVTRTITQDEMKAYAILFSKSMRNRITNKKEGVLSWAMDVRTNQLALIHSYKGIHEVVNLSEKDLDAMLGAEVFRSARKGPSGKFGKTLRGNRHDVGTNQES